MVNNTEIKIDGFVNILDDTSIKQMFDVNVIGTIHMTQAALKLMKRNPYGGSIVNFASIVGLKGNTGQSIYGASKGAAVSLTTSWSKELAEAKIRVNAVAPGSIDKKCFTP